MRSQLTVANQRRVLCIFPAYTPSFGTFSHAYRLLGRRVRGFMPPQGLLLIAAYLPEAWPVRFNDENITPTSAADLAWADVVLVSGMHVQAPKIQDIYRRVKAAGKAMVLGGPSVSAAPEMYPEVEYLHIGEIGDATDALIATLDKSVVPPPAQVRFETKERLPLTDFPLPAYHLISLSSYLMATLQFSSGCPYLCEFCDIPNLYGRVPRLKTPEQITAELDAIRKQKAHPTIVYFVDDNFIGNRKAARDVLPHVIAWQKKHGYPVQFSCEATLNVAKQPEILRLMREAAFIALFAGIETPEADALKAMRKDQNNSLPMMDAIKTINSYGMELISGIIVGLDTDSDDTEERIKSFIDHSHIPMQTTNLLQALPKTALWDRLKKAGRLNDDPGRESNVEFVRPYDEVVAMWRRVIGHANSPEQLYARYYYQVDATYVNRMKVPIRGKLNWSNLRRGATVIYNVLVVVGLKSDYRRHFWRAARYALRRGRLDAMLSMGFMGHHMIQFTREALRGEQNASFYSLKRRETQAETASAQDAVPALRKSA